MAEKFKNFYIDHVLHQQNAHVDALASLAASLTLPARALERVLVYSRDLYVVNSPLKIVKPQKETFKLKRFLRFR